MSFHIKTMFIKIVIFYRNPKTKDSLPERLRSFKFHDPSFT